MKSYAKINIFLKIVGFRENYHEIASRFILLDDLYDEIEVVDENSDLNSFFMDEILDFRDDSKALKIACNKKIDGENIIRKIYKKLVLSGYKCELDEIFKDKILVIKKNIPQGGGLGGGSSNGACFLKYVGEILNLPKSLISKTATSVGCDLSFFLSGEKSANVSGLGENIEPFDDKIPPLQLVFKDSFCDTGAVYREFRKNFKNFDIKLAQNLMQLKSDEILSGFTNLNLNDLMQPCINLYGLNIAKNEFLSGSGATCFKVKI